MPYHDYICPKCGREIVNIQRTLAELDTPMICPSCRTEMEQRFNIMHTIFRGKGWTEKSGKGRTK